MPQPNPLIERLLHPRLGVERGILKYDDDDKLVHIKVGELRDIARGLAWQRGHINAMQK